MIPLLLYLLAILDATFCGYRAAAGRSALINKRAYYARALARGTLYGNIAVAIAGCAIAAALLAAPDPRVLWEDLFAVGRRMLLVYLPYAALLGLAFGLRAFRSVDLRSLTSTLVFGPLTLVRPIVMAFGVLWGVLAAPRAEILMIGALVLAMMLSLERLLGRHYADVGWAARSR